MDHNNERKAALLSELKKALLLHGDYRAWRYGLDLSENDDPNSLSAYLKLTKEQYEHEKDGINPRARTSTRVTTTKYDAKYDAPATEVTERDRDKE